MVGSLKVVAQVFAVGKPPSMKDIVGIVSNPRVGGTVAPVAKIMTSSKVAWASLPKNKTYKFGSYQKLILPSRETTVLLKMGFFQFSISITVSTKMNCLEEIRVLKGTMGTSF